MTISPILASLVSSILKDFTSPFRLDPILLQAFQPHENRVLAVLYLSIETPQPTRVS